jgi:hypothetical protein
MRASEFIFQPREDAFHCGALAKTDPLMGVHHRATAPVFAPCRYVSYNL